MIRPQPLVARPWPLRWLLVVLTLAGLALWQGGHCADDTSAGPGVSFAATSPGLGCAPDGPAATADTCPALRAAVSGTTAASAPSPTGHGPRAVVVQQHPQPLRQRLLPGVTLVHLGISRT